MKIKLMLSVFASAMLAAGCSQNTDQSNMSATESGVTNSNPKTNSNDASYANNTNVDNTAVNARDRGTTNLTALDQGNSDSDTKTTASIRKMVMDGTNNFSTTAQNIKIITQNGKVALRGPVISETEKTQIEAIAKSVAGDGNVQDDLEVKANP